MSHAAGEVGRPSPLDHPRPPGHPLPSAVPVSHADQLVPVREPERGQVPVKALGIEGMTGDAGDPDQMFPDLADPGVNGQQLFTRRRSRSHGLRRTQQQALDEAVDHCIRRPVRPRRRPRSMISISCLIRDYHRQGAEDPALGPCVIAQPGQPFPDAVGCLARRSQTHARRRPALVAERDPAVGQLGQHSLGDQALQQGPAPVTAGQQSVTDALCFGPLPGAGAEFCQLADTAADQVVPLVVVAAAGLGQPQVDCLDERAGNGGQACGAELESLFRRGSAGLRR